MKIKTSDLNCVQLDWAVAKCEHDELASLNIQYPAQAKHYPKVSPSTDWSQGGPIIEREISKIWRNLNGTFCAQIKYRAPYYSPTYDADIGMDAFINKHGPTPLIAAMRCYVAHKLGDEVDIPDELIRSV